MIEQLTNWFAGFSFREKLLVSLAGGLSAGLVAAYGIYLPLTGSIEAKRIEYRAALERRVSVEATVEEVREQPEQNGVVVASGPIENAVSEGAIEAGFTLDKAESAGNGRAGIAIAQARPSALLKWLAEQEEQGIIVEQIAIKAGANGTVSVDATLARRGQ